MVEASTKEQILNTLNDLHAAQQAHDVDAMLSVYAEGFVSIPDMRTYFEALIERDALRSRTVDMSACETFVYRNTALVRPVIYHTPKGPRYFSFHLDRGDDGRWRIIDNRRSQSPDESFYLPEFVANAAKVVGSRGMLWIRRFDVPVEAVWAAISTKDGLDKWWLTRSVEIDLRSGGLFKHHWTNAVTDFRINEFIDFGAVSREESGVNTLMRFEVKPDGKGTVFSFFDSFHAVERPLSLPWTSSGWHGTVDALETALTGRKIEGDFGLGGEFYWRYLRDFHRFAVRASEQGTLDPSVDEWRQAYLADSL